MPAWLIVLTLFQLIVAAEWELGKCKNAQISEGGLLFCDGVIQNYCAYTFPANPDQWEVVEMLMTDFPRPKSWDHSLICRQLECAWYQQEFKNCFNWDSATRSKWN